MRSLALAYMMFARATTAFMPGRRALPGFRFPLAFSTKSMAEKVLTNPKWPETWPYTKEDFMRMDETNDSFFYDQPRLVYHIDDVSIFFVHCACCCVCVSDDCPSDQFPC